MKEERWRDRERWRGRELDGIDGVRGGEREGERSGSGFEYD